MKEAPPLTLTRRKFQVRETRECILETALSLFRKKGFDQVAGVSKGPFSTYFQTKGAIVITGEKKPPS